MKDFIKYCIHQKHNIPLDSITTNSKLKYITVKGQVVVKTCQSGKPNIHKNTKTLKLKSKDNGNQKTHLKDSERGRWKTEDRCQEKPETCSRNTVVA